MPGANSATLGSRWEITASGADKFTQIWSQTKWIENYTNGTTPKITKYDNSSAAGLSWITLHFMTKFCAI